MSTRTPLRESEIRSRLRTHSGWSLRSGKLHRELQFGSFVRAFGFMCGVALVAERMNHHPEWCNVYGTVRMDLMTHDAGGVTELDFQLAAAIDQLVPEPVTS